MRLFRHKKPRLGCVKSPFLSDFFSGGTGAGRLEREVPLKFLTINDLTFAFDAKSDHWGGFLRRRGLPL
jgi:fructose-1,6-bisphosphatase/inositol monophosphatase family enzyme